MNEERVEYFRAVLTGNLNALLNEVSRSVHELTNQDHGFADPTDWATVENDRSLFLNIRGRGHKLMFRIQEALERLENGAYGICEECGEEIPEQRLRAYPFATMCIDCKSTQEEDERRLGKYSADQ